MPKRISSFAIGTVFVLLPAVLPAAASSVWAWSYSGTGITASGTFITEDSHNSQGGYLITGITGTRNGQTITTLQTTGTAIPGNEPFTVDNLVFPGPGPQLTSHGFGFAIAGGTYSNPFFADFLPNPGYLEFFSIPAANSSSELPVLFSAVIVSTPEPCACGLSTVALAVFWLKLKRANRPL